MSSVQSLGLHEPSALPYLVAESILPADPPPSLYKWTVSRAPDDYGAGFIEEEVLVTEHCVVWSRNRAIKRALNLNVEGEPILHAFVTQFGPNEEKIDSKRGQAVDAPALDRALVVVLKTQVHVFLLSGDGYILPVSFEVESAFPFPYGFILQRKLGDDESSGYAIPAQQDLSTINETLTSIGGNSSRPSLNFPDKQESTPQLVRSNANGMPRTFSFTEVMSQLGLVVWSPSRKGEALEGCNALPRSERLLFVSHYNEGTTSVKRGGSVCMALTLNESNSAFTLWHVRRDMFAEHAQKTKKGVSKPRSSLRKSSNIYGRDQGNLRESLAGPGQPYPEPSLFSSVEEQKSFPANDLASQLGPEFGDVGVQTRSARRVSSMLARTDLGSGNDRNTFNDIAMGHPGRQSLNRTGRRGESIGSFNDRQSFGFRRRSSFPTNASILSTGTSFLDVSARGLLEELDPLRQSTRLEEDLIDGSESNLPRDIGFFKVKTFPRSQASEGSNKSVNIKVLSVEAPDSPHRGSQRVNEVYLCVLDKDVHEMTLIRVFIQASTHPVPAKAAGPQDLFELKSVEIRRLSGIDDVCKIVDGKVQRLAVLTQSRTGLMALQLEAPWSPSFRVELPERYAIYDPFMSSQWSSPRKDKDTGIRRVIPGAHVEIRGLVESGSQAQLYTIDQDLRRHCLQFQLSPRDPLVRDILRMCDVVLNMDQNENLLIAFWEVARWLKGRDPAIDSEWISIVVVIFSLAVPFISKQVSQSTPSHRRKKTALLRSSSGSAVDLTNYDTMHNEEDRTPVSSMRRPAWDWLSQKPVTTSTNTSKSRMSRAASITSFSENATKKKSSFLIRCMALAREYTQTPLGENALGPEGYLPTAINRNREQRCDAIPSILVGLHLLYEESKLNISSNLKINRSKSNLVMVMAQLGRWLGWRNWTSDPNAYYEFESPDGTAFLYDDSIIDGLKMPSQPFPPPSIYDHLESWINGFKPSAFLTLARIARSSEPTDKDDPLWQQISNLTPRTLALLSFLQHTGGHFGPATVLERLLKSGTDLQRLGSLPDGVAAVFYQALASKRNKLDVETSAEVQLLLGSNIPKERDHDHGYNSHKLVLNPTHEAVRDYHNICSTALESEALQRWDASSEADRHALTKLIFSEDRRFPEASKLVNQTRPPVIECTPEPEWSEVELLEAQKELAQHVTRRTLSVAAGRGMMHFNARVPLLTERVPIPAFSLQCIMKPRNANENTQAMTFSADKATFTEEKVCWAFFHNGASMGLMIANDAKGVDTSWILYNKPPELTNRHAGFLLALGLNGHLKTLAKWVAFKYLTPKHTMTSVGLLLGLSASFLGSMDTLITRLLSVHVTRLLPPGAAELNLSPLTQTTGIMGIGLLYHNSQHRRMSEVMLSEIENNDPEESATSDNVFRDEGYRLAAGFSLGLINLGQGKRLHTLHDMSVVERLLTIAVGTKNVNLVHVLDRATAGAVMAMAFIFLKTNDAAIAKKVDVPDTLHQFEYVRPDIFLLRTLARHLIMWDSIQPTQDFIEASLPEPYRQRVDLKNTKFLSTEDMPFFNIIAGICFAIGLRFAGSQRHDVRDMLVSYLDQFLRLSRLPALNYDARVTLNSVRNCLDALALASACVVAGSGDLLVMRRLRALHGRTDKETPFGSHLAAHMALGALFLAGGTRTFGTSNLAIASLCIAFYPIFPNDVLDNRGHLQALRHLWVLAVEGRCLVARDGDAGGSVVGGIDGFVNLKDGTRQSIRLPGLIPEFDAIKSIDIQGEGFWDGHLDFEKGGNMLRQKIKAENAVNVLLRRRAAYDKPSKDLFTAELQAKAEAMGIPSVDPNAVVSFTGFSAAAVGMSPFGPPSKPGNAYPLEWLFELDSLKDFDHAERALVLGQAPMGLGDGASSEILKMTVVDSRLELEKGILPSIVKEADSSTSSGSAADSTRREPEKEMDKEKLWQLRLLFAWFDRWEREDEYRATQIAKKDADNDVDMERDAKKAWQGRNKEADGGYDEWFSDTGGTWLRREVIERLRWRVWALSTGDEQQQEFPAVAENGMYEPGEEEMRLALDMQ